MPDRDPGWPPPLFGSPEWQMSFGERAALEGLLAQCRPSLAIEVGTAQGGSLERLAVHSDEVHAIDLVAPDTPPPANVEVHVGDSRRVLPKLLARLAKRGRSVDFALVDGDHTPDGVRHDVETLLASPAVSRTVIVLHDTMNVATRAGIRAVAFEDFAKVRYVELDFLTGYMGRRAPFEGQLWGGFGIVVADAVADAGIPASLDGDRRYHDAHEMIARLGGSLEAEEERSRRELEQAERSSGSPLLAPLRALRRSIRR
jgi:Methyltransferase domain